jgi:hypothetical protein
LTADLRLYCLFLLAALCFLAPRLAQAQDAEQDTETASVSNTPMETNTPLATESAVTTKTPDKQPVESELIVEGLASYGNYKIFASGTDCKLYTAGLEYDRHVWGNFLRARLDYVAEILPLVILNEPDQADIWGNPKSYAHKLVPGFGFSPIGFRMMWRNKTAIEPYLTAKGGMIAFPIKVISTEATYESFSLQSGFGVQARLTPRLGMRLGLWSDFHFSDAFMVPVNPGLDVMNANLGLSYHFGQ